MRGVGVAQFVHDASEKLACVIDEYGGVVGIVTMEDLAEEILGDVTDEHALEEEETPTNIRRATNISFSSYF